MAEGVEVTTPNSRYFCYQCNREVSLLHAADLTCPNCSGDFLEEVSHTSSRDHDYEEESDLSDNEINMLNLIGINDLFRRTVMNVVDEEDSPRHFSDDEHDTTEDEPNEGFLSVQSMIQGLEDHLLSNHRLRHLEDYLFGEDIDTLSTMLLNEAEIVGPPPLPKEQIKLLPTISVSKEHVEKGIQCTICMEDFIVREKAKNLPCEHFYHEKCITPWLERHGTCPNCRKLVEMPVKNRRSQSCPRADLNTSNRDQRRFSESSSISDFFTTSLNPFRFL